MTAEILGKKIRAARERKGLDQKECAAALGVAQSTWSEWETGESAPRTKRWKDIARFLGMRLGSFLA